MKILALIPRAGVEKQTAYMETIKALVEKNVRIDLVIVSPKFDYVCDSYYLNQKNICVQILRPEVSKDKSLKLVLKKYVHKSAWLERLYGEFTSLRRMCSFWAKRKKYTDNKAYIYNVFLDQREKAYRLKEKYDYIWVESECGLLWANWLNIKEGIKCKIVYHCLELYWENYLMQKKKKVKYFEKYFLYEEARKILLDTSVILIQDELRWNVLCQFTGLKRDFDKVIFPVSIRDYNNCIEGELFKKINIERDKKVIFYPTFFAPERGCEELSEMAKGLSDKYIVIMHGFIAVSGFVNKIKKKNRRSGKVIISNTFLEYHDLLNIHKDVWCIFLFYGEKNYNDKFIVNSSNKLVMGLQAGKPIVTIGNRMMAELCERYRCGVALETWSNREFCDAITEIEQHYKVYCENARRCYEEMFDTRLYVDKLFEKLLECAKEENENVRTNSI